MTSSVEYTIDELARIAGVTVRSVRVYHERGVLPPPRVRGRTGYYDTAHLARLQAIGRLLERGMKLAGIKELFEAWERGEGLAEVLGLVDQVATPYHAETTETVSVEELGKYGTATPENLRRAITLGVYEPADDAGTYRVLSPRLSRFGAALIDAGVPVERALAELERLTADCDRIAARHVRLFHELIWEPYKRSPRTPDDLAQVTRYLAVTRNMSTEAAAELISRALQRSLEADTPELLDAVRDVETGHSIRDAGLR